MGVLFYPLHIDPCPAIPLVCHSAGCFQPPGPQGVPFSILVPFVWHQSLEPLPSTAGVKPAVGLWKPGRVWASALNEAKLWQETSF